MSPTPKIRIELHLEELDAALEELPRALDRRLLAALSLLADDVVVRAKETKLFVGSPAQTLRNSIDRTSPEGSFSKGEDISIEVFAGAPHAIFVELGTREHVVRPRFRKSLRWPVEGGFAFAKSVKIPAQPPRPFMQTALDEVTPRMESELQVAVELAALDAGLD